jgi:hypothetical protein
MAKRYRWQCPQCGQTYAVPSTQGLTICPRCQADEEIPLINIPPEHGNVYWSKPKVGSPNWVTSGIIAVAAVIFGVAVILVLMGSDDSVDKKAQQIGAIALGIVVLIGVVLLYFLPSIIAYQRAHRNFVPILILNLAFAWTFVAWIGLMVWATISTVKIETERTI